jgi:hypothetical protein
VAQKGLATIQIFGKYRGCNTFRYFPGFAGQRPDLLGRVFAFLGYALHEIGSAESRCRNWRVCRLL